MPRLLQFSTPTCGQCPEQEAINEELAAARDVAFEKVDATQDLDRANRYGVRGVPTTVVLDDDDGVVAAFNGLTQPDDIADAL